MPFRPTPAPAETIWGTPDRSEQILPGIWHVTTPSHGGFILSGERQAAMPAALRLETLSYEEDVDWALVFYAFAGDFERKGQPGAKLMTETVRQSVRVWHPERYAAHTGESVPEALSPIVRRRAAYQAVIGEYVSAAAYGDWADWVPEGKVGIVARRVAGVDASGFARYSGTPVHGLVDATRYHTRDEVSTFEALGAVRVESDAPITKQVAA